MSRSHHITKREAAKLLIVDGDVEAVVEHWKKQNVKKVVKKFRPIYKDIHPSGKSTNKLRGSVAHRTVIGYLKTSAAVKPDKSIT